MQTTASDLSRVARWFHALSDDTRLRIAGLLAGGERCVCHLRDELDEAQSRLSFHLRALRRAGKQSSPTTAEFARLHGTLTRSG